LGEEDNGVLVVAEVVVDLEVVRNLLVIHLGGHEVPFDEGAFLAGASAGQFVEAGEAVGEEAKEG
jgi:hypothetical protein